MRRKRKTKYTWFPVTGQIRGTEGVTTHYTTVGNSLQAPVNAGEGPNQAVFAPTTDQTSDPGGDSSLADVVQGQDWLLKRIVGKIHLCTEGPAVFTVGNVWPRVLASVGFFVGRSVDTDQAQIDLGQDEVEPLNALNSMNPWIWRRTWILQNPRANTTFGNLAQFPTTNAVYGGVMDGGHIDSKVSRRITREHRLWCVVSVVGVDSANSNAVAGPLANQPILNSVIDVRILGAMRRGKNVSSF